MHRDKQLKRQIAAQIKKQEREFNRQEKMYREAADALPMALDPVFCQRVMAASKQAMAQAQKAIDLLKRAAGGGYEVYR